MGEVYIEPGRSSTTTSAFPASYSPGLQFVAMLSTPGSLAPWSGLTVFPPWSCYQWRNLARVWHCVICAGCIAPRESRRPPEQPLGCCLFCGMDCHWDLAPDPGYRSRQTSTRASSPFDAAKCISPMSFVMSLLFNDQSRPLQQTEPLGPK